MARRRRGTKEVELIQSMVGLVLLGSVFFGYRATGSLKGAVIAAGCVLGLIFAIFLVIRIRREEKLRKSGIQDIDKMDGIQFEHYLKLLFRSQGYQVEVTRAAGDYGADLILRKDGRKIAVQAKRYNRSVGISAIQEVVGSKAHYNADEAWVVTNRDFTEAAENLAKSNGVRLIDRDKLIEMVLKMNPSAVPNPQKIMEEIKTDKIICDRCGREMVLRSGPKGQFYGCSGFPKCRNTKAVRAGAPNVPAPPLH